MGDWIREILAVNEVNLNLIPYQENVILRSFDMEVEGSSYKPADIADELHLYTLGCVLTIS